MLIVNRRNVFSVLNCVITFPVLNECIFSATSLVKKNSLKRKLEIFAHFCRYFLSFHKLSDKCKVLFDISFACSDSLLCNHF